MRKSLLAAALFLAASAASAIPPLPPPPAPQPPTAAPPRLLIAISVDQFSADLFDEYRPQFTGGLARIASGTAFRNGYQSHAATETCPGHSTILTGDHPARTGIIANDWVDQGVARTDKTIYCAEDSSVAGSTSSSYTVSDKNLAVRAMGDWMKLQFPGSRNVAVAGKDRAAVMMSGHSPDQRWYWRRTGFTTDLKSAPVPASVARLNSNFAAALAQPRAALEPPPYCAAKATPYTIGRGKVVGNNAFARAANDVSSAEDSPEFDGAILALAGGLINDLQLGKGSAPDVLAIGLSATDYVGHTYGTQGQEMCLQLLSLDRSLGDFLSFLDASGIDYAIALTADHGGFDIPERVPGGQWVDPGLDAEAVGKALASKLGLSGPVLMGGYSGDIYIDHALSAADRTRALDAAIAAYRSNPQVEQVFTRAEIEAIPMPSGPPDKWSLIERLRASYNPARSGDLLVVLKPKVAPYPREMGIASTHGTPWDYDRRVPILFWRPGFAGATMQDAVETVDILPTLAGMIGLAIPPGAVDGRCLQAAPAVVCPPR